MLSNNIKITTVPAEKGITTKVLELFLEKYLLNNIDHETQYSVRSDLETIKQVLKANKLLPEEQLIQKYQVIKMMEYLKSKAIDGMMERYIQEKIDEVNWY